LTIATIFGDDCPIAENANERHRRTKAQLTIRFVLIILQTHEEDIFIPNNPNLDFHLAAF